MTQVAITLTAEDFDPVAIGVDFPTNRAGYFIVEGRPAAVGLKLVFRAIQRLITLATNVNAGIKVIVVFSGKRPFSAFLENDPRFFRRQWFSVICHQWSFLERLLSLQAGYQRLSGE
jgi:hypothetical protein